jgi:hypothetical protein
MMWNFCQNIFLKSWNSISAVPMGLWLNLVVTFKTRG